MIAALRSLTQRRHTHLWLAVMTCAAQTRVVSLRGEVVALVYDIVFYVNACLPCGGEEKTQHQLNDQLLTYQEH